MKNTTTVKAALVYCLIAALMVAPVSYAAEGLDLPPTPLNHDFTFAVDGKPAMAFKRVDNGYLYWCLNGLMTPKLITDAQLASVLPQGEITPGQRYPIGFDDGFGGKFEIGLVADGNDGTFGRLETPKGSYPYEVQFAEDQSAPRDGRRQVQSNAVVIVIGAAAVGVIACAISAYATDCGSDCSSACGSAGVSSFSEGWCGSCTCRCK